MRSTAHPTPLVTAVKQHTALPFMPSNEQQHQPRCCQTYPFDLEVWFVCPCTQCTVVRRKHEESGKHRQQFDFIVTKTPPPAVINSATKIQPKTPSRARKLIKNDIPGFYPTAESLRIHLREKYLPESPAIAKRKTTASRRGISTTSTVTSVVQPTQTQKLFLKCPFVTCGHTFTTSETRQEEESTTSYHACLEAQNECFVEFFNHLLYQHASNICFVQPTPTNTKLCKSYFMKKDAQQSRDDMLDALTSSKKVYYETRQATIVICDSNLVDDYKSVNNFVKSQLLMECPTCGSYSHTNALFLKHKSSCKLKMMQHQNPLLLYQTVTSGVV